MNRIASFAVLVAPVLSAALVAQRPAQPQPPQKPPSPSSRPAAQQADSSVVHVLKEYQSAFNKGDPKALAALYTEDGVRLGPKNEVLHGRAAIEKFYVASFAGDPGTLSVRPVRTHMVTPDVAVLEGRYEVAGTTGIHGVYIVTVVRQGGRWKFASVVAVPDGP